MSRHLTEVVEGWTGALPFQLKADGVPVDLTGMTVSLWMKDTDGTQIHASTSGLTVTGTTSGVVSFAPTSDQFVAAKTPYRLRFKVVDALTKTVYFPNVDEDVIKVNQV
jgi:hypothetical protein